ncbi:hypothetical protein N7467_009512 [Penicillium canescens]|nr:hypothetical protein N7467_009512 [Penicillium canescens]
MKGEDLIKIVVRVTSVGYVVDVRLKSVVDNGGELQKKKNIRLLFHLLVELISTVVRFLGTFAEGFA